MLYNLGFVCAVQQCESAVGMHLPLKPPDEPICRAGIEMQTQRMDLHSSFLRGAEGHSFDVYNLFWLSVGIVITQVEENFFQLFSDGFDGHQDSPLTVPLSNHNLSNFFDTKDTSNLRCMPKY